MEMTQNSTPQTLHPLESEAQSHFAKGQYDLAAHSFRKRLTQDPLSESVILGLAQSLRCAGLTSEAQDVLKAGKTNLPQSFLIRQRLRESSLALHDWQLAHTESCFCRDQMLAVGHDTSDLDFEIQVLDYMRFGAKDTSLQLVLNRFKLRPEWGWGAYRWVSLILEPNGEPRKLQDIAKGHIELGLDPKHWRTRPRQPEPELDAQGVRAYRPDFNMVTPPAPLPAGKSLTGILPWFFREASLDDPSLPSVYQIEGGRAFIHDCGASLFTKDGDLLRSLSSGDFELFEERGQIKDAQHIPGRVLFLADPWSDAFFHWHLETLPQIYLTQSCREIGFGSSDKIFVRRIRDHHLKALESFGVSREQVISSEQVGHQISADQLIRIPHCMLKYPHYEMHPWIPQILRQVNNPKVNTKAKRRLYIRRKGHLGREIINESEVHKFLESQGFEAIEPERLSQEEQIIAFASAQVIVGAAGGAMSNLVYVAPGTNVLLFYPPTAEWRCYWSLLGQIQAHHWHIFGSTPKMQWRDNPDWMNIEDNKNFHVDLKSLKRFLHEIAVPTIAQENAP